MNKYTYWAIVALAVLVLLALAEYPFIGQMAIGAYALLAFWRLQSGAVFRLALVSLGVMLAVTVVGWVAAISAFSTYAFMLFLVGVFVLVGELWRFSKALRKQKEEDNAN